MSHLLFLDNHFHRDDQLLIGVNNRSFRYGDGVFETMKCSNEQLLLADFHFDRLFTGLSLLGFELPSFITRDYLLDKIRQLLHRNGHSRLARVRLTGYRGDGGPFDPVSATPHVLIQSWSLPETQEHLDENGLVLGVHGLSRKSIDGLSNCKTNNYLYAITAAREAKNMHWNDALLLNTAGRICETTIANVFLFKGDTLITPALAEGPVAGTMRRWILTQAQHLHMVVEERGGSREELLDADEAFVSNAVQGIRWVREIGDRQYGQEKTAALYQSVIRPLWAG